VSEGVSRHRRASSAGASVWGIPTASEHKGAKMTPTEARARTAVVPGINLGRFLNTYTCTFSCSDDPKAALREVISAQKQLRVIKSHLALSMKEIRARYRPTPIAGVRGRELQRIWRDQILAPYKDTQRLIDQLLIGLEKLKLDIRSGGAGGTRIIKASP
jgi:hypothetical protein